MKRVIGAMLLCVVTSVYALDFDIGVSGRDDDVDGFLLLYWESLQCSKR